MKRKHTIHFLLAMVAVALSLPAAAQKKNSAPPESLSAAWAPVKVDHYLGIKGGYAMSGIRLEPQRNTSYLNGLIEMGIVYRFDVPQQKYLGTIEFSLNVSQKGYKLYESYTSTRVYERTYTEINFPIVWQPYLPLGRKGSRFYASAGPFGSYALSSSWKEYDEEKGTQFGDGNYTYEGGRDNRWGYGITVGGGFFIAIRSFSISMEYRYNIGLSDIFKSVNKYDGNPFRSPVDQMTISLGVNYKLPLNRKKNNNNVLE